jgi:hypothetical protein
VTWSCPHFRCNNAQKERVSWYPFRRGRSAPLALVPASCRQIALSSDNYACHPSIPTPHAWKQCVQSNPSSSFFLSSPQIRADTRTNVEVTAAPSSHTIQPPRLRNPSHHNRWYRLPPSGGRACGLGRVYAFISMEAGSGSLGVGRRCP